MVRLVVLVDKRGEGGATSRLASFFKSPEGVDRRELSEQFRLLYDYAERRMEGT